MADRKKKILVPHSPASVESRRDVSPDVTEGDSRQGSPVAGLSGVGREQEMYDSSAMEAFIAWKVAEQLKLMKDNTNLALLSDDSSDTCTLKPVGRVKSKPKKTKKRKRTDTSEESVLSDGDKYLRPAEPKKKKKKKSKKSKRRRKHSSSSSSSDASLTPQTSLLRATFRLAR